jgi:hypothetical protein
MPVAATAVVEFTTRLPPPGDVSPPLKVLVGLVRVSVPA